MKTNLLVGPHPHNPQLHRNSNRWRLKLRRLLVTAPYNSNSKFLPPTSPLLIAQIATCTGAKDNPINTPRKQQNACTCHHGRRDSQISRHFIHCKQNTQRGLLSVALQTWKCEDRPSQATRTASATTSPISLLPKYNCRMLVLVFNILANAIAPTSPISL